MIFNYVIKINEVETIIDNVWSDQKKISNKLAEKPQLVSSQQWNRPNDMFSLHTVCFFRQDDGDAGDDDVSSDDNTDILLTELPGL
jgi:hypothetical protein